MSSVPDRTSQIFVRQAEALLESMREVYQSNPVYLSHHFPLAIMEMENAVFRLNEAAWELVYTGPITDNTEESSKDVE